MPNEVLGSYEGLQRLALAEQHRKSLRMMALFNEDDGVEVRLVLVVAEELHQLFHLVGNVSEKVV